MEIQYQRNFGDYQELLAAQQMKPVGRKVTFAMVWGVIYVLAVSGLVSLGLKQGRASVAILTGTLVVGLISLGWRSVWLRRDFRQHPNFVHQESARIDEAGLHVQSEVTASDMKWIAYTKYQETQNLCLLYLGARMAQVFPKRAFSGQQLDEFRQLVRMKVLGEATSSTKRSQCGEGPS